jgi:hypothetical protein
VVQLLVKWSSSLAELATWEDLQLLKQRFPHAPAWGQATCYGGGNVTTASNMVVRKNDLNDSGSGPACKLTNEEAQQECARSTMSVSLDSGPQCVV